MVKLTLRIDLTPTSAIGPGKIQLLEHIGKTGSISAAGRAMGMSYRRAWLLVDELNRLFRERVAIAGPGGKSGGGAKLTPFGRDLISRYREMETTAHAALSRPLAAIGKAVQRPVRPARRRATAAD